MFRDARLSLSDWFETVYRPCRLLGRSKLSLIDYRSTLKSLDRWHGTPVLLADLSDDLVFRFLDAGLSRGWSPYTANKHRGNILALWRYAIERGELLERPAVRPVPEPRTIPAAWTLPEFSSLLTAAASRRGRVGDLPAAAWWLSLLLCLYDTGARIGALLAVECGDVSVPQKSLRLRAENSKTKTEQVFAISSQASAALERLGTSGRRHVWPWPFDPDGLHFVTLHRHLRQLLGAAGLPVGRRFAFHRIRRTTATQAAISSGPEMAARLLGHASQQITRAAYIDAAQVRPPSADEVLPRPTWHGPEVQRELF